MARIPFVDIHTHPFHKEKDTIIVQNIFPGEGFAAFTGRNFYSVGLHPWHIKSTKKNNELLQMVEDALEFDHVLFVGEAGLDKAVINNFEEQKRIFEAQAFIAEEYKKPLIIHCVRAFNEVLELHKKMQPEMPWIMHGYNGNIQITKAFESKNVFFSFGENLFRSNSKLIESFRYCPLDRIFLETDEFDGEVESIYKRGAELRNIPLEILKEEIWENFNKIERISSNLFY